MRLERLYDSPRTISKARRSSLHGNVRADARASSRDEPSAAETQWRGANDEDGEERELGEKREEGGMQGEEEGRGREERKQKGRAHGRGANWEEGRGRIGRGGRGGRESRAAGPRLTEGSHLPLQPWPGRGVAPAHWGRWHQAAAHFVVHLFGRLRARWGRGKAVQRPLPVIWRPVSVTACRYGLNNAGPAEFDAQRARADRAQQWDNKCSTLLRRLSWGTRARPLVLDLFSGAGGVS